MMFVVGGGLQDSINVSRQIIPVPVGNVYGIELGPDNRLFCASGMLDYITFVRHLCPFVEKPGMSEANVPPLSINNHLITHNL